MEFVGQFAEIHLHPISYVAASKFSKEKGSSAFQSVSSKELLGLFFAETIVFKLLWDSVGEKGLETIIGGGSSLKIFDFQANHFNYSLPNRYKFEVYFAHESWTSPFTQLTINLALGWKYITYGLL